MLIRLILLTLLALPAAPAAPPTPASHFGHPIGVDKELLDWDKVVTYFQALEKSSDRLKFKEIGKSAAGRPFIAVTIASPATLKNLEHARKYTSDSPSGGVHRPWQPGAAEDHFHAIRWAEGPYLNTTWISRSACPIRAAPRPPKRSA